MGEKLDIITIGESLIELSSDTNLQDTVCFYKYYGGDTLTTAVAAQRLGSKVGYITRVGNDCFKEYLLESWKKEGLDISQVKVSDDTNGVYMIARTKEKKEAAFYRKKTAAARLSIDDISNDYIENTKILYTSGVAQSISLSAKEAVKKAFSIARENDITTAYDPNYNASIMTPESARENFDEIISDIDILFLSARNDVHNLLEISSIERIIKHFWDVGIKIIVVKSTENLGYYTGYNGDIVFNKYFTTDTLDTTCSGDAFNGGFLHAISSGYTPFEATKLASVVAGLQAQGIGAIKSVPNGEIVFEKFKEAKND